MYNASTIHWPEARNDTGSAKGTKRNMAVEKPAAKDVICATGACRLTHPKRNNHPSNSGGGPAAAYSSNQPIRYTLGSTGLEIPPSEFNVI